MLVRARAKILFFVWSTELSRSIEDALRDDSPRNLPLLQKEFNLVGLRLRKPGESSRCMACLSLRFAVKSVVKSQISLRLVAHSIYARQRFI
jgi:hypothetical protein